ncbi:putative ribosomal protein S16 [Helianthus annuus]|nr:putative ribosomal protein S16 [Helianthus annuus]
MNISLCSFVFINVHFCSLPKINKQTQTNTNQFISLTNEHEQGLVWFVCSPRLIRLHETGQDGGKRMGLNFERVKYWLSVGAQPSDPVQRLLFRAGVLPPPPMVAMGRKGGPRDIRPVDPLTGRVMMAEQPTKTTNGLMDV